MRRALWCVLPVLAGCSIDLGPPGTWVPADAIEGELAPVSGVVPSSGSPMRAAAGPIRIATFNVEYGADPEGLALALGANPEVDAAAVILIQEVEAYPGEAAPRAQRLAEALGYAWAYVPARTKADGTHGLAILSRFPIEDVEVMHLRETGGDHPRIAVSAEIMIGATPLHIIDVHLGTKLNIRDRILQLRPIVLGLEGPVIVGGDVNTSPFLWSDEAVPVLPAGEIVDTDQAPLLDDYMRQLGFDLPAAGVGPTEHKYGIEGRLDAFYTRGLVVAPAHVERSITGSDHWPVWFDVERP